MAFFSKKKRGKIDVKMIRDVVFFIYLENGGKNTANDILTSEEKEVYEGYEKFSATNAIKRICKIT